MTQISHSIPVSSHSAPSPQPDIPTAAARLQAVPDRAEPTPPQLWEYEVTFGGSSSGQAVQVINEMGAQGWELVAVVPPHDPSGQTALYLKRPLHS